MNFHAHQLLLQTSGEEFSLTKLMDTNGYAVGSVKFRAKTPDDREVEALT
jgi:hypothetical protein